MSQVPLAEEQRFSQPHLQSEVMSHEGVPQETTKSPASKHHKESYSPSKSMISSEGLNDWLRAPITGNINEIPGIGDANGQHLLQAKDGSITTTYELFAKFMSFKKTGVTQVEHCDLFYHWLKESAGIHMRRDTIVQAVAAKCNIMFPGIYDETIYSHVKKSSE